MIISQIPTNSQRANNFIKTNQTKPDMRLVRLGLNRDDEGDCSDARLCEFLRSKVIYFFTQQIFVKHLLGDGHCAGPEDGRKDQRNVPLLS